jgi:hypothetical protein
MCLDREGYSGIEWRVVGVLTPGNESACRTGRPESGNSFLDRGKSRRVFVLPALEYPLIPCRGFVNAGGCPYAGRMVTLQLRHGPDPAGQVHSTGYTQLHSRGSA